MSSLKPPLDQHGAPREQAHEQREAPLSPGRPPSGKRKSTQRSVSPTDMHEPALKQQRSHEKLGRTTELMRQMMTPVTTDVATKAKLSPVQRAERSLASFAQLLEPSTPQALAQHASALLPLTDHAEGFKIFSAAMPDGSVYSLAHHEGDTKSPMPPQHIELAMYLSFMLVKQKHLPAAQWREQLRASPNDKRVPHNLLRSGSRLTRRGGQFYLSPSSTFDLPTPDDPAYDNYVQVHVNFLRGIGAQEILHTSDTPEMPPTPPPSSPGSENSSQSATYDAPRFGSGVAAMCRAINAELLRSAK